MRPDPRAGRCGDQRGDPGQPFLARVLEDLGDPGARHDADSFEVACLVPIILHDDVEMAANFYRPMLALYIGGMGARDKNFYNELACRYGFEGEAKRIQDLYLDGKKAEAAAVVPDALCDEIALVGPKERIRDRLAAWHQAPVGTMIVGSNNVDTIRMMAELVL